MADLNLTQAEADALIHVEKHRGTEEHFLFPLSGQSLVIPLHSVDKREDFFLDIQRSRIDLQRGKYQNRARQVVVLVRLDFGGAPHRNPDGEEILCPHIHLYREGYGAKWAMPVPVGKFGDMADLYTTLYEFMRYCNITLPPHIEKGLFT